MAVIQIDASSGTRADLLDALVDLRLVFFAGWPFLVPPDRVAQTETARRWLENPHLILVTAFDGPRLVGINMAVPLADAWPGASPFDLWLRRRGMSRENFACAQTHTLPDYRGKGLNSKMMERFDAEVARAGFAGRVIEHLVRPANDTRAPEGFTPATGYFLKRGFERIPARSHRSTWADIGDARASEKIFELLVKWASPQQKSA